MTRNQIKKRAEKILQKLNKFYRDELESYLIAKGITLTEFESLSGISHNYISQFRHGKINLGIMALLRLAIVFELKYPVTLE